MKYLPIDPPRLFGVGQNKRIQLKDCAHIDLDCDEQVTFKNASGSEYDVTRKSWGYYATPSLNRRLVSFGLMPFLIKSQDGTFYIFLVEKEKESDFRNYLEREGLREIARLDGHRCPLCGDFRMKPLFHYDAPPEGEIRFGFTSLDTYQRDVLQCGTCGHCISFHQMESGNLYAADYVNATYGDDTGLKKNFDRIISLDPSKSDNLGRVQRILQFMDGKAPGSASKPPVMDVGSGLCVFLHRMKSSGWDCTAIDPDPRSIRHAREVVGVRGICGDFMKLDGLERFDLITFNKVLEHVADPVTMLSKSAQHLTSEGIVYVELPDGEAAAKDGPGREEFFIDHLHVFSATSLNLLAFQAGFSVLLTERLREPSSKYTLRAFLKKKESL